MVIGVCGRYTFFTDKELREVDEIIEKINEEIRQEKMKTGEISPTDTAPVLVEKGGVMVPRLLVWGFPNLRDKRVIINARAETAREKKMFSASLESRRCVIPSTGFYEWDASKKKYLFNNPGTGMLYMAGLYDRFEGKDRFVILTTDANRSMSEIHDRMPVVISKDLIGEWLCNKNKVDDILFGEKPELIRQSVR
jgi:putative SOS response-associated peptidase YedK